MTNQSNPLREILSEARRKPSDHVVFPECHPTPEEVERIRQIRRSDPNPCGLVDDSDDYDDSSEYDPGNDPSYDPVPFRAAKPD